VNSHFKYSVFQMYSDNTRFEFHVRYPRDKGDYATSALSLGGERALRQGGKRVFITSRDKSPLESLRAFPNVFLFLKKKAIKRSPCRKIKATCSKHLFWCVVFRGSIFIRLEQSVKVNTQR